MTSPRDMRPGTLAGAAPQSGASGSAHGVFRFGAALIAVSIDSLLEVIPCPAELDALPATTLGLLGAVRLRGMTVPALDLRAVLGLPAPRHADQVLMILRQQGHLLALLTDGVIGIARPGPAQLHAVASAGLFFSGCFEHAEGSGTVSVLDIAAVLRLPGVPTLRAASPVPTEGEAARPPGRVTDSARAVDIGRHDLMLVRCGSIGLAVPLADIHSTLPQVALQPSAMDGPLCRGRILHDGHHLPAVDPLVLLGLGRLPEQAACRALLLGHATGQGGLVALLVSEVMDIVSVSATDLPPLPPMVVRRARLFSSLLKVPQRGELLVLATGALNREPELVGLKQLNTPAPAATRTPPGEAARARRAAKGNAVLSYDIGGEVATRMTQIDEVLLLPEDAILADGGHPAVVGLFSHRGQVVALVDLARLLGRPAPEPTGRAHVLLVRADGVRYGFIVSRLFRIDSVLWEQPAAAAVTGALPKLGAHPLIELGDDASQRRTCRLIDLQRLARSLGTPAAASEGGSTRERQPQAPAARESQATEAG